MIVAGVDIGSTTTKAFLMSDEPLVGAVLATAPSPSEAARKAIMKASESAKIKPERIQRVLATGYGRKAFPQASGTISEITAQAKGVSFLFPKARSILDIGGQDSKVILLNERGEVQDFVMNDKCAAGTGRFLEFTLQTLGLSLEDLSNLEEAEPYPLNTTCAVFAQSEVVSLLTAEVPPPAVVSGLFWQIATKAKNLASRLRLAFPLVFTGGLARIPQALKALSAIFRGEILVPQEPQLTAALGAALVARGDLGPFSGRQGACSPIHHGSNTIEG